MALIPTDPKQQRWAAAGVGALIAFYLFYSFVYTGQREEVTAMQTRLDNLEQSNRRAQITAARGGAELEQRLAEYERHVIALETLIPASDEVPALLREITAQARALTGVDPAQFRPEPDEPGEFYTLKAYQMQAIGEYHDIARFLTAIASLARIITPVDVSITPYNGPAGVTDVEDPVVAEFRIETYVLPPAAQTPPPAQVGGTP
jgi:type IV pilus assembly protein PilO